MAEKFHFPKLGMYPYDNGVLGNCDHLPLTNESDGATNVVICVEMNLETSGLERVVRPRIIETPADVTPDLGETELSPDEVLLFKYLQHPRQI